MTALEKEMRRRVWWCVYGLDRVLSIALGRPSGAHDEDCDVELRKPRLSIDPTTLISRARPIELIESWV